MEALHSNMVSRRNTDYRRWNNSMNFKELDRVNQILALQRIYAAADAFHSMGFIKTSQLQWIVYENETMQMLYDDSDSQWDCPCCQADYMDADYYLALLTGHDDGFEDAFAKSNREKARDRFRRNTTKQGTFGMRGYKSRGRTFKRG